MQPTHHLFITAIFTITMIWKQPKKSINRGLDKEDVAHICNVILAIKQNHAICSNMDGPRGCHSE